MIPTPTPTSATISRRQLLRDTGLVVSMGALVAACGGGDSGPVAAGRLGVADEGEELPPVEVDDIVLLRTLQSLEYTALDVYAAALDTGELTADETALVERFVADHTEHATAIGSLITAAGGEEFACANPFFTDRVVVPMLAALEGSDDVHRDLVNIAYAFETWAAASYQAMVTELTELELRSEAMRIGGEENRHATALGLAANPDQVFSPEIEGGQPETDAEGFPLPYAVPATFGQLTGVELIVGAPDADGQRFSVNLQTPAQNSYVYDHLAC